VNAEGTLHVVAAARRHGAERVLVVGSAEEYGRVDPALPAVTEDAPLRPITPYGVSKVAASFVALQAWLGSALPTIRVRPFNHTGPGQRADFLVPALAARIAEAEDTGSRTVAVGALDPVRDLTDVRDVVRAYRLLVAHAREGEVYNVCRGTGVTVGELARRMLASARGPCELRTDPGLVRPVEVPRLVGDATKLRRATGWEPRIDLDDTLAAVLEHARAARAPGQSS
jgi:GDP-4-dehydro-6-deoxy-D-mannose reductase